MTEVEITALAAAVLLILRIVAPAVQRRWPGSWIDKAIGVALSVGPDLVGAGKVIADKRGTAAPLVTTQTAALQDARLAYEAYAESSNWIARDGTPMPPFDQLPLNRKASWLRSVEARK